MAEETKPFDPTDQMKLDQWIADLIYFNGKYGNDFLPTIMLRMLAARSKEIAELSDQEKSYLFKSGVGGLQKAAETFHNELFGHPGQSIEIEGHDMSDEKNTN